MLGVVDKPALTLLVSDMAWMLHVHCARLTFTPSDALHLRLAYQRQGLHVGDRRTYEMASIIVGWRLGMQLLTRVLKMLLCGTRLTDQPDMEAGRLIRLIRPSRNP